MSLCYAVSDVCPRRRSVGLLKKCTGELLNGRIALQDAEEAIMMYGWEKYLSERDKNTISSGARRSSMASARSPLWS
jgi:hypothetical protein